MEVLRYFKDPTHLQSLLDGYVWIGTLSGYRRCEEQFRGDPREGHKLYNSGYLKSEQGDGRMAEVLRRAGFNIRGNVHGVVNNVTGYQSIRDAYVLCTACKQITDEEQLEIFGNHAVLISDVDLFAHRVTKRLFEHFKTTLYHRRDYVQYTGTSYSGLGPDPGALGFIKDDSFRPQHEYRLMWEDRIWQGRSSSHPFEPFLLHVPRVSDLCTRVRSNDSN